MEESDGRPRGRHPLQAYVPPIPRAPARNPGHEIPNTEYITKFTENRTESTETEIFGSLFGS